MITGMILFIYLFIYFLWGVGGGWRLGASWKFLSNKRVLDLIFILLVNGEIQ